MSNKDLPKLRSQAKRTKSCPEPDQSVTIRFPSASSTILDESDCFNRSQKIQRSPPQNINFPSNDDSDDSDAFNKTTITDINPTLINTEEIPENDIENPINIHNILLEENQINMTQANITIGNIQETGEARLPKFTEPEIFTPALSNAKDFIKNFERCAIINNWKDEHKITYFGSFLQGLASTWYTQYKSDPENTNKTWNNIVSDFLTYFSGLTQGHREIKIRLLNRKQSENETVKKYFYSIIELCNDLNPDMQIQDIIDYFEAGLHPIFTTHYTLLMKPNMTFNELRDIVNKLDEIKSRVLYAQMNTGQTLFSSNQLTPQTSEQSRPQVYTNRQQLRRPQNNIQFFQPQHRNRFQNNAPRYQLNQQNFRNQTRTRDGRPICFSCGKIGHLQYNCNNRQTTRTQPPQQQNRFVNNQYQRRPNQMNNQPNYPPRNQTFRPQNQRHPN